MPPDRDPDSQCAWWDACYRDDPELFGSAPSEAARRAAARFHADGARRILEVGAGHGRDTLFLAAEGFAVTALDYSDEAILLLRAGAEGSGLGDRVDVRRHDVRAPLPFGSGTFDGVYAHMLLCMEFTMDELATLVTGVRRVLRPGGSFIYTVRHTGDAHATAGIHRPDGCREHGGFVVRFFDDALVRRLAKGFVLESVEAFEEGALPRRLWCVTMRRPET